ncbi:MAG TPA: sulfatase [Thermoleophilaceae bacterium]|nr:sulfatase [Thermoleophilaceae bacterium]
MRVSTSAMLTRSRPLGVGTALTATLLALALLAPSGSTAGEPARRPNIVVLMTDDQTLESLRVMPNVRELLGERGTTFSRSFVSFSLCCPSRATYLTGQYAHNHGVLSNRPPTGGYTKLDKSEWLPLWLQQAGYRTIHLGKFLNGYGRDAPPTEVPPGWNEWYGSVDPSTYRFWGYTLNENGLLNTYGVGRDPFLYSSDYYSQRAVELIARHVPGPQPLFLNVAFLAPHSGGPREPDDPQGLATPAVAPRHRDRFAGTPQPLTPAFNEADVSDKPAHIRARRPIGFVRAQAIQQNYQQRLESLLAVDEGIARILGALRGAGELDDTLVVFTSDNGFFHGEHRVPSGKVLVYEPSVRVPLILRGPGVPKGERRHQLVTNADLAPTILEAAGGRPGKVQDGRSLFGLLRDGGREWGRDLLIEGNIPGGGFDALRTYRYLYAAYSTGERELYDLELDPHQLQSLHADPSYRRVKAGLARRLAALKDCAGRACRARPTAKLRVRRCVARVSGGGVERVAFQSRTRARVRRAPFRALAAGRRLRARVRTLDGRVVTLDRRLPRACR